MSEEAKAGAVEGQNLEWTAPDAILKDRNGKEIARFRVLAESGQGATKRRGTARLARNLCRQNVKAFRHLNVRPGYALQFGKGATVTISSDWLSG